MTEQEIGERVEAVIAGLSPIVHMAMNTIPSYADALRSGIRIGYCAGQSDALDKVVPMLENIENKARAMV